MAKQKKKAKRRDKLRTRSKPLTLEALKEYGAFKDVDLPSGGFDPNGEWEHVYQIWLVHMWNNAAGYLRLKRSPEGNGISLSVEQHILQSAGTCHVTKAKIISGSETIPELRSWTLESVVTDIEDVPIADTLVAEAGAVNGEKIEITAGDRVFVRSVPSGVTSSWSLIDAVQRLPGESTKLLHFAMLEDLDLLKAEQMLSYGRSIDLGLSGESRRLTRHDHLGRGILPEQFFVDEQHRLLVALSGIRAYLYDPKAQERLQKRIGWQRKRRKQK